MQGTVTDKLIVEIRAETAQLQKDLQKMKGQLDKAEKSSKGLNLSLKNVATALAAVGAVQALGSIVQTTRSFEDLKATLKALTGSVEGAEISFGIIEKFTATTTFQLQGVTQAFITLLQAGITPTQDALQDFGNLAAAFDKDISVLAQAVFRAMTGEMEMLKQFNVVMKVEGDKFKATFNGVTTSVDRNGMAISEYIRNIARTNFPTALEDRANTLTGAISNLQDAFDMFQFKIGMEFKPVLIEIAKDLTDFFRESDRGAKTIGSTLAGATKILAVALKNLDVIIGAVTGALIGMFAANIITGIGGLISLVNKLRTATTALAIAEGIYLAIKTRGVALLTMGALTGAVTTAVMRELNKVTEENNDLGEDDIAIKQAQQREETRLSQIMMKSLDATQLLTKSERDMIAVTQDLTKVKTKLEHRLNSMFGFDLQNRTKAFNNQLDIMRKIFTDRKLLEALNNEGFVKQGIVKEVPADQLGFFMDFNNQDTINQLNANRDIMTNLFLDEGFVDAQIIAKEVEKDGEVIVKGFIRGIEAESASNLTGEDRFAQFLGFKDHADMSRIAEHFLPAGNIQKATKQFLSAIDKGIGDSQSLGFSGGGEFETLKFFSMDENIESLKAYKNLLQEEGLLPPGLGDDVQSLKLFQTFLKEIVDEGERSLLVLSPMADALKKIADEAKNPTITFEDFTDEILNNRTEMTKLFNEINAKYPTMFESVDDFIEHSKNGVESLRDTVESASDIFSGELLQAVVSATNSFTNDFVRALLDGQDALESFKSFAKNIVSQIISIFLQMAIINKIINSIFNLSPGDEGYQPELNVFGESASGGRMQRGKPYLVGERGMELFVPDQSGTMMNNMNTKGAMGGTPIIINQSLNFSTGVQQTVRAEVMSLMPQITEASKQAVSEGAMRGGSFRRSLRGT